jgi:hypothetical protein
MGHVLTHSPRWKEDPSLFTFLLPPCSVPLYAIFLIEMHRFSLLFFAVEIWPVLKTLTKIVSD